MLLIIGSRFDSQVKTLMKKWRGQNCTLMRCEDLSRAGWQFDPANPKNSTFVANSRIYPASVLTGVLTLRPFVFEKELYNIHKTDRAYLSFEMTAFLLAWLSSLTCSVINPPAAPYLSGPAWSDEMWLLAAAKAGFMCHRIHKTLRYPVLKRSSAPHNLTSASSSSDEDTVIVIGKNFYGSTKPDLLKLVSRLAKRARVNYIKIAAKKTPDGYLFLRASTLPDCADPMVVSALEKHFNIAPVKKGK